jgi:hypothetical protein
MPCKIERGEGGRRRKKILLILIGEQASKKLVCTTLRLITPCKPKLALVLI